MKALKITGIVVVALAAIIGVLGMIAPKQTHVERSVTINAPKDFVWSRVNTLAAMEQWSPWKELDPNQEVTYEGADGTVGAIYHWKGNDQVGEGKQVISAIEEGSRVDIDLQFLSPMEAQADVFIALAEEGESTTVTWAYDAESAFPFNIINLFVDMDEMMGPDFEKGVNTLKTQTEEAKSTRSEFEGFAVQTVEMPAKNFVGVKSTVKWADMKTFFETSFANIGKAAGKAKAEPTGAPVGVYYTWDQENQQTEMVAAMPMAEGVTIPGFESVSVSGKALSIDYYGPYEGTEKAHMAIEQYMKWHGVQPNGPAIEEYVTGPETEPDPSKWQTKIYYPVK